MALSLDNWLHFFHVLAAMVWVGGGVILSLVGLRARSSPNPAAVSEFGQTLPYIGLRVLLPALVAVLVTGVWMVLVSSEWHFTQPWVLIGLSLFVVAFLIGAVYLGRVASAFERASTGGGGATTELGALLNRWLLGYWIVLIVLMGAVWDM